MKTTQKKLLFICTQDWFYHSHFSHLGKLAQCLGITDISIACGIKPDSRLSSEDSKKLLPLDFKRNQFKLLPNFKLIFKILKVIKKENPDLVHFISLKPILLGGLAALAVPKTKKVYHLTGLGHVALSQSFKDRLIKYIFLKLVTILHRDSTCELILENHNDFAEISKYKFHSDSRITIVGGAGIDPHYLRQLPPPQDETTRGSFVGRMINSKGVDVLVEACAILNQKKIKFHLDLYGKPDFGNPKPYSYQQLEDWNEQHNISWKGHIEDVRQVWGGSDIAIVPSRGGEGLPKSLLEAAACGRPIITTDVPGCNEFVRHGREGFIVPPDDPESLAQAIEILVHDPDLRTKMGLAARKRVLENYTHEKVASAILPIYQRALGSPSASTNEVFDTSPAIKIGIAR